MGRNSARRESAGAVADPELTEPTECLVKHLGEPLSEKDLRSDPDVLYRRARRLDEIASYEECAERAALAGVAPWLAADQGPDAIRLALLAVEATARPRPTRLDRELRADTLRALKSGHPGPADVPFDEPGRLRPDASQLARAALRRYQSPDPDGPRHVSLWYAQALDAPRAPTMAMVFAYKAAADASRAAHDRLASALRRPLTVEGRADLARLHYIAARDHQAWQDASYRAGDGALPGAAKEHRRRRLQLLLDGLGVEGPADDHGHEWTLTDVAELLLSSPDDWTRPPCEKLADAYRVDGYEPLLSRERQAERMLRAELAAASANERAPRKASALRHPKAVIKLADVLRKDRDHLRRRSKT